MHDKALHGRTGAGMTLAPWLRDLFLKKKNNLSGLGTGTTVPPVQEI